MYEYINIYTLVWYNSSYMHMFRTYLSWREGKVCLWICMCIYVCVFIYLCKYARMLYTHTEIHVYMHTHVHSYLHTCKLKHICMYVCI
jgi:hypothetical protein